MDIKKNISKEESKGILTPKRVVRNFCFECVGRSSWQNIVSCEGAFAEKTKMCPFHKYRLRKTGRVPIKAFRLFCLQCMGGSRFYVKTCENAKCLLFPYRMGKNPTLLGRVNKTSFKAL